MTEAESKSGSVFDEARLERLVELMKQHDLREVELRDADQQIRICRSEGPVGYAPVPGGPYGAPAYAPPPPYQSPPAAPPVSSAPASNAAGGGESDSLVVIRSPMVGTYYSKPNPNAPTYVKVGDHVEPETTVCIIEAMKVFNEIPAEVSGKIVAVLADNEEPVEFGKPLFKVDTKA